jgi:hypothetical protein
MGTWTALHISEYWMNLLSHNLPYNSTISIGKDDSGVYGGFKTVLQHITLLKWEIALTMCSERIVW